MFFLSALYTLAIAGPLSVIACQSHVTKPPVLWLADLRSGNPSVDSDITRTVSGPGLRLIRFEEGATPIPITPEEKIELEKSGLRYFDVTEVDVEAVFHEAIKAGKSGVSTRNSESTGFPELKDSLLIPMVNSSLEPI
jgi:hypothetical protein